MDSSGSSGFGAASDRDGIKYAPVLQAAWWNENCEYAKFNRQGIEILTASFVHHTPKAAVVLLTGWSETFLKYSDVIKAIYDRGFSVFTYDHQSQGLSGRWLAETQSTWVHSFEDYVDDFVYFVTSCARENAHLPMYLLAQGMGGLIASIAMSRLPTLINRAVLSAPMFRNKCGMKALEYAFPVPQPIVYWIVYWACKAGLGTMNTLGFFKEKAIEALKLNIGTSDAEQLHHWQLLRQKYPALLSTCVTNDWVLQSIRSQKKFSRFYEFVGTNTLILAADANQELFVHNRAMTMFLNKVIIHHHFNHKLIFINTSILSLTDLTIHL